jgi:prophage regulatory protein
LKSTEKEEKYWRSRWFEETNRELFMKVIRLTQVKESTGLGRSTIYKYIAEGKFPAPLQLSERCVGWLESEVQQWIQTRADMRNLSK